MRTPTQRKYAIAWRVGGAASRGKASPTRLQGRIRNIRSSGLYQKFYCLAYCDKMVARLSNYQNIFFYGKSLDKIRLVQDIQTAAFRMKIIEKDKEGYPHEKMARNRDWRLIHGFIHIIHKFL